MRIGIHLALLLMCGLMLAAHPYVIRDGQSDYRIVLSPQAPEPERNAARELQHFLQKATGATLPIGTQAGGKSIYVGQQEPTRSALGIESWNSLRQDEIILKTIGDDLYLTGAAPRGTLYAVYEYLEREVGVMFLTASVNHIPAHHTLALTKLDYRYAPPFEIRAAGYDLIRHDPVFAARTRNNGHGVVNQPAWGGSVQVLGSVHTFSHLIPSRLYFKSHPEWFAMRHGKRIPNGQLCLSNPELRKELVRRTLLRMGENPGYRFVSVSQNDGGRQCQCPACRAFIRRHGTEADLLLLAVNQVAEAVEKSYPQAFVETLAYGYTRQPPKSIIARDNVIVRYCTIEADSFRPLEAPVNRRICEDLRVWQKHARQFMIWNYVTTFRKYYIPFPNWHTMAGDLRFFRDRGAIAVYEQGSWNGGRSLADLADLRAWVLSKLLWNPSLDLAGLTVQFARAYYGEAASGILGYIRLISEAIQENKSAKGHCYVNTTNNWLEPKALAKAYKAMRAAYDRVKGDPVLELRMALALVPISSALLENVQLLRSPRAVWPEEIRHLDLLKLIEETVRNMQRSGVASLQERHLVTPGKWGDMLKACYGMLPNDAVRKDLAGDRPYHSWSIMRIAELHALNRGLFVEKDASASIGKAVRMPNTHAEWHIFAHQFAYGAFEVYADVRCDSSHPDGDAIHCGVYDWKQSKAVASKAIRAADIAGKTYRTIKLFTVTLNDDVTIYVAPAKNAAVRNMWIDTLTLIPVK